MSADDELRRLLTARLPDLHPEVETELERLLARADHLAHRRRAAYVVGLVAAAVVAAGLVLNHDWRPDASRPEPVDNTSSQAEPLTALGMYLDPAALEPGRYRAHLLAPGNRYTDLRVELDVPAGWGQDDVYAFATGPGDADATRRIDLFAHVPRVAVTGCSDRRSLRTGTTALDLATTLSTAAGRSSSGLTPVTLDGHPGYRLRLHGTVSGSRSCADVNVWREPGPRRAVQAFGQAGWTTLLWVLDVGGVRVVVSASHGPAATPAQEAELVAMVESVSFVVS